jgi:RNA polymerase sigma-70 factor (ECF subfamily)
MPDPAKHPSDVSADDLVLAGLMDDYLAGRLDAFDGIYTALAGRIRGYLLSLCRNATVADDLLQETFLQMHRSRHTYDPGRPVTPWLFASARHVYLMHRRGTARRLRFEDRLALDAAHAPQATDDPSAWIDRDHVEHALRRVPADQRTAVVMHHVQGWSFAEIAAKCGIKVNAAKTRAFRGIRHLREQLARR